MDRQVDGKRQKVCVDVHVEVMLESSNSIESDMQSDACIQMIQLNR